MKASLKFAALSLALLCSCQSNDGWQKLFNGKDLTGFKQLNGEAPTGWKTAVWSELR